MVRVDIVIGAQPLRACVCLCAFFVCVPQSPFNEHVPWVVYCIQVVGQSFMYKMVRNLVGAIVAVGRQEVRVEDVQTALLHANHRKLQPWITAPAHGLALSRVHYGHKDADAG